MDALIGPILRFLHYALLMGLFGLTAFRLIGLKAEVAAGLPDYRWRLTPAAIAAPILSCALMLVLMGEMMDTPLTALDWPTVKILATQTSMGWAFLLRVLTLVVAGLALALLPLHTKTLSGVAGLYAVALTTLVWSGHAAATQGNLGLIHRANDAIHLLTTSLWMGAIGTFLWLAIRAYRAPETLPPAVVINALRAFAPLGLGLVVLAFGTGLVNAELIFGLAQIAAVSTGTYGQLLAVKIALVAAMLGCAAFNAWSVRQGRRPAERRELGLSIYLRASLSLEFGLLLLALAFVAWLGTMMPMAA